MTPAKHPRGWLKTVRLPEGKWKAECRACPRRLGGESSVLDSRSMCLHWWHEHRAGETHQKLISIEHIAAQRTGEGADLAALFGKSLDARGAQGITISKRHALPS